MARHRLAERRVNLAGTITGEVANDGSLKIRLDCAGLPVWLMERDMAEGIELLPQSYARNDVVTDGKETGVVLSVVFHAGVEHAWVKFPSGPRSVVGAALRLVPSHRGGTTIEGNASSA